MEKAIAHCFNTGIKEKTILDNGWKETFLLTLSNDQKVVFRSYKNYTERFKREQFFYETVNSSIGKTCPKVYVIDGTCDYYDKSFQISEFLPGKSLCQYLQNEFDDDKKRKVYYQLGALTAKINQIEILPQHPYVAEREPWEIYFADKLLRVQLDRIVPNKLISKEEANILCNITKSKKAKKTYSFLHRDIRPDNIIYNNGDLYVIDAETCEFGDPLNELSRINLEWTFWEMYDAFFNGYKSIINISIDTELFGLYQLEWLAELLDMHYNHNCMNSQTSSFLERFVQIKNSIIKHQ
ncbi:MAG: aminoglycoside phosphotransferase family protein [Clostridia bacterium]|nr:aminoglycoside phosphotransferase family protein [Clostridia bacterium]